MRKWFAATAAVGIALLGVSLPAGTAQAATACDNAWNGMPTGYMRAYQNAYCGGDMLGQSAGNDSNWGNGQGAFQGSDTNRASSVLNKGTTSGTTYTAVQFLNGTGTDWGGGYICLKRGELYADYLGDNYFTSGYNVNDAISSHRWLPPSACSKFLT
ncbi:hypothetical protein ACIQFU_26250 [Streptomyces sp. NPDC093065]|uniref:hypothetical protein n=1 Tax=Streptomyces sp. NPDC093065 TaxID=3366021 RepID=UPI003814CCB3